LRYKRPYYRTDARAIALSNSSTKWSTVVNPNVIPFGKSNWFTLVRPFGKSNFGPKLIPKRSANAIGVMDRHRPFSCHVRRH
jgi:hypothetical protein